LIVLCLAGGLGNQLFQYSFGRFVAYSLGAELWIDTSHYAPGSPTRIRVGYDEGDPNSIKRFELEHLQIHCQRIPDTTDLNDLRKSFRLVSDDGQLPAEVIALGDKLVLRGEWSRQLDYLFIGVFPDLLRRELRMRYAPDEPKFKCVQQKIRDNPNSVAVQIRRGNYKYLQHMFTLLGEEYYSKAFCAIEDKISEPKYFVFSDEIEWVQENFRLARDVEFVKTSTVIENFELSRTCHHVICANSTYSWWTAYLVDNLHKVVVMPRRYYGNEEWQAEYEKEPSDRYIPSLKL